ncbi:MAG: FRG domain-containing protein [Cloacibacillus sp.]
MGKSIQHLSGFINIINAIKKSNQDPDYDIFFRGHESDSYKLIPTLFRKNNNSQSTYEEKEDLLFHEFINRKPENFINDKFAFEKLQRMQHFSLPTRMLDITSNPFAALYFACKAMNDNVTGKGVVISLKIKKSAIKFSSDDTVCCIANLAQLKHVQKNEIKDIIIDVSKSTDPLEAQIESFNLEDSVKQLVHRIGEEKPFFQARIVPNDLNKIVCVRGKLNNERILAQSGSFLLYGLNSSYPDLDFTKEQGDWKDFTNDIQCRWNFISPQQKTKLLQELEAYDISQERFFPQMESTAEYIKNKYLDK